jgi:hypothetical protein
MKSIQRWCQFVSCSLATIVSGTIVTLGYISHEDVSDHPVVLDQVTGITGDSSEYRLRAIVANNPSRTHGVLDHQAELSMSDTQNKERSKRIVDV